MLQDVRNLRQEFADQIAAGAKDNGQVRVTLGNLANIEARLQAGGLPAQTLNNVTNLVGAIRGAVTAAAVNGDNLNPRLAHINQELRNVADQLGQATPANNTPPPTQAQVANATQTLVNGGPGAQTAATVVAKAIAAGVPVPPAAASAVAAYVANNGPGAQGIANTLNAAAVAGGTAGPAARAILAKASDQALQNGRAPAGAGGVQGGPPLQPGQVATLTRALQDGGAKAASALNQLNAAAQNGTPLPAATVQAIGNIATSNGPNTALAARTLGAVAQAGGANAPGLQQALAHINQSAANFQGTVGPANVQQASGTILANGRLSLADAQALVKTGMDNLSKIAGQRLDAPGATPGGGPPAANINGAGVNVQAKGANVAISPDNINVTTPNATVNIGKGGVNVATGDGAANATKLVNAGNVQVATGLNGTAVAVGGPNGGARPGDSALGGPAFQGGDAGAARTAVGGPIGGAAIGNQAAFTPAAFTPTALNALATSINAGGPASATAAQTVFSAVQAGATLTPAAATALTNAVVTNSPAALGAIQTLGVMAQAGKALPNGAVQALTTTLGASPQLATAAGQALGAAAQAGVALPPATVAALTNAVATNSPAALGATQAFAAMAQAGRAIPAGTVQALTAALGSPAPVAAAAGQALSAVAQAGVALPPNTVQALTGAVAANAAAAPGAAQALSALARSGVALPVGTVQVLTAALTQRNAQAPAVAQAITAAVEAGAAARPAALQVLAGFVQALGQANRAVPPSVQATAAAVLAGGAVSAPAMQALVKSGLDQLATLARQAPAQPVMQAQPQGQAQPQQAQAPAEPRAPRAALTMGAPASTSPARYAALDAASLQPAGVLSSHARAVPDAPQPGAAFAGAFSASFAARVLNAGAPLTGAAPGAAPPPPGNPVLQALIATANTAEAARLDKAVLDATARLTGPLGRLLADGVAPGLALAAQQLWEGSVLGGWNPATGTDLPPIWVRWRLRDATELDNLVERLTGQSPGIAELARARQTELPSRVGAALLGQPVAELALPRLDPRRAEPSVMALAAADFTAGLNGLVRLDGPPTHLSGATGLTAVGTPDGSPLLLAHLRPQLTAAERIALGAGLSVALGAAAPGIPASATVAWSGDLPDPALGAVSGSTGGTVGGMAADRAADRAGAVLAQLAAMLLAGVRQGGEAPASLAVQVPLDGSELGAAMRFPSGQEIQLGAGLPGTVAGAAALGTGPIPDVRVNAALGLGGPPVGRTGAYEVLGPHVTYNERRAVPLDIAPATASVAAWRLDDTEVQAAIGPDGAAAALAHAKRLYHKLQAGKLPLDQLPPGAGFSTWDGSPAWLGLAQVQKPAGAGVLPGEAEPPRVSVLRAAEGDWLLLRRGGKEGRNSRQAYARDAAEDAAFYNDAVFGLPHGADLHPPGGSAGALAARGFKHARAAMAEPPGPDRAAKARVAEAWGFVARLWAGVLDRLGRTGAGRLATRGDAVAQAGALREIAGWSGSVPALASARDAKLDLGAVLAAVGADTRASLTRSLAPAALLLGTMEPPGPAPDMPEDWPAATRFLATGRAEDRDEWGQEALALAADGRPHLLEWDGALALAGALGRLPERGNAATSGQNMSPFGTSRHPKALQAG